MKNTYIIIVIFLAVSDAIGQTLTTDTIQWDIAEFYNVNSNTQEAPGDKLIVYAGNRAAWSDSDGNVRFDFAISEVLGTWDDISQPGGITLGFSMEGQPGQVVVTREGSDFLIEIKLYMDDPSPQEFRLRADTYSVL